MSGNFQKKTLKILAVDSFDPAQFLRRIHSSSIPVELAIVTDVRTHIFISVSDKSLFRENSASMRFDMVKSLLDGCKGENSEMSNLGIPTAMVHVVGTPVVMEKRIDLLVQKLLDLGIKSCIIVNLCPLQSPSMSCPFKVSMSIVIYGSVYEVGRNLALVITLVRAIFDDNSISVIVDRRPRQNLKRLLKGRQLYSTLLDLGHACAYFQLPQTYGIDIVKKMSFPVPNAPFRGIELGKPFEFSIGEIDRIRLEPERLFEHMAVWGASGTGKTTFLKNLLLNIDKTGTHFCVLDWNNEYRSIASKLSGQIGKDIVILNPFLNSLSVNPLELFDGKKPRHIRVWERIENFISLIKQMFILGELQEARLRQALSQLYQTNDSPTISDAIIYMSEKQMKSVALKLDKFTKEFYGQIFNRRHSSLSFSELRRRNVIIELGQLPSEVRMFFACVFLILWWDSLQLSEPSPNVLVLDDFYRYANLEVMKNMFSEARKFKQGLICSHQGPYQLPQGVREEVVRNTATKVIFRQEQTWDKHIVRDALGGLTKEQLELLSYMETGEAIVKVPTIKFPIRIRTHEPPRTKLLMDAEIKRLMVAYSGQQEVYEEPRFEEPLERKFLKTVLENKGSPLTEITKALGIKTSRGYRLKDKMVKEGFVEEEKIRSGIGRPKKILKLTKKGFEYIDTEEVKSAPQFGKAEHIIIKEKVASLLAGWAVKVEDGCDIKAEKDGKKVAIEIETGKTNEKKQILYNFKRDSAWADIIVFICPNKQVKLDVVEVLGSNAEDATVMTYRELENLPEILAL